MKNLTEKLDESGILEGSAPTATSQVYGFFAIAYFIILFGTRELTQSELYELGEYYINKFFEEA